MSMRPSDETRVDNGVPAPAPDAPAVLGDRYEVGPALGHGGTATVYRAHDRTLQRTVAVKLFAPGAVGPDHRRHDDEVRTLARLNHPGLVALYDAGSHEGRAYLVMQLVEGQTLAERIDPNAPPSPETTTALGAVLADSLRYVHDQGVVHRDLKPANVLLDTEGHPMITDFGIARLVDTTRVTATGFMVGTAAYLAPEQVRGEPISPATDIYSLGLVLLECVTGRREYPGGALEAAVARLHRPPAIPDGLPEPLAGLLRRMTADDPAGRPPASAVATALAEAGAETAVMGAGGVATQAIAPLAASPAAAPADLTAPRDPAPTPPEPQAPAAAAPARRRRKLALLTAGGAGAAVAAAVLTILALGPGDQAPAPPAQPAPAPVSPVEPQTGQTGQPQDTLEQQPPSTEQPPPTSEQPAPAPPTADSRQPLPVLPPQGTTDPEPSETGQPTEPQPTEPQPTDSPPTDPL